MIYEVIVDIANSEVDKVYDYSADFDIALGSRVLVPFGYQRIEGFVFGIKETSHRETKDIISVLDDTPIITEELIGLAKYLKAYKNLRFIDVLRLCIPPKLRGGRVKELKKAFVEITPDFSGEHLKANAKKQAELLERLKSGGEYESVLNAEYGNSAVKGLIEKGMAQRSYITHRRVPYKGLNKSDEAKILTVDQRNAVNMILSGSGKYLLHGVTGSGKTEVYMNVIESVLMQGKTAIMLVPEISLTPQMLGLFRARFGERVSLLHSGLSDGERYDEWRRLLSGEAVVALGARSAIYAPLRDIGVIIIDEEHDGSYVSESNPRYFTHDIAEYRAEKNGAALVLGSATPSMETYKKAVDGQYTLITLNNRINERALPSMEIVDMRKEIRFGNFGIFSRALERALGETIESGNQAMIFVNRRGFASFIRCRDCGYVPKCTDCEVSLTYHKEDNRLKCHYCGKEYLMLDECPACHGTHLSEGKLGTERVVEELSKLYPEVKTLRMDYDTTLTKDSYVDILSSFARGDAQILVGTQMIAKGHDFPNVTLVGILDADLSLYFSDYRSNEHTYQLITQVAGRAGRKDKTGKVVMQTYNPNHYVFRYAERYDYCGFFDKEINVREATGFPPYTVIVRILTRSETEMDAYKAAREGFEEVKKLKLDEKKILRAQAMRAPIKRLQKYFRFQIVVWVTAEDNGDVINKLYKVASEMKNKSVNTFVEVNPTQMM